jgi:riboflavin transporter FmnP
VELFLDQLQGLLLYYLEICETANFLAGTLFIVPIAYIYRKHPSLKALSFGLVAGTAIMTAGMAILNYFIFLPAYAHFLNFALPNSVVITAIIPFNLLKGLIVSVVFVVLFQSIKVWLQQKMNVQKV